MPPLRAGQRLQGGDLSGRRKIDGDGAAFGIGLIEPFAAVGVRALEEDQSGSL